MNELNIYKQTAKMVVFTVLTMVLSRLTKGTFLPVFSLLGVWCAFSGKLGWALVFYVLMPFFAILNPALSSSGGAVAGYSIRLTPVLIGLILAMMASSRRGRHRLPLGWMFPFLLCAALSSMSGWAPMVSYMKLVNFVLFLLGIWLGTQNLQDRPKDVFLLRSFFLAMSVILIWGSLALIPFPSISYATSLQLALLEGGSEYAADVFRTMQAEGVRALFCGVTNHSQALAPMSCCAVAFVLCDMLCVERRFSRFHLALLASALPLLYMTRSRVGLVTIVFIFGIVGLYTVRKMQLASQIRQKLGKGLLFLLGLVIMVAFAAQLRGGAMSAWLRKTDQNQKADRRSLGEALTESRMGLMEYSLYEYRRNPLFGSGFQVAEYTRERVARSKGLIISSPIEKGVLPVMVLGETGILGETAFLVFLFGFYGICTRRHYYVTITTFSVFLMTNFGEATFFSPGGGGGTMWMFCVVGGFTIDTVILFRKNLESQWAAMAEEQMRRAAMLAQGGR